MVLGIEQAGGHARDVLGLPQHLVDIDDLGFALDRQPIQVPRTGARRRIQQLDRLLGSQDLATLRQAGHAGGHVDRVTEYIALFLDRHAVMQADADGHVGRRGRVHGRQILGDCFLQFDRAIHAAAGGLEGAHDFVTDGLDDDPGVLVHDIGHQPEALGHQLARNRVAEPVIQSGAAADIGKHDGQGRLLLCHVVVTGPWNRVFSY